MTIRPPAPSRPSRSASGMCMTRMTDPVGGGTAMAVGGTEYSRRRAASAPATPAISPAPSPPGSPHRVQHRYGTNYNGKRRFGLFDSHLFFFYALLHTAFTDSVNVNLPLFSDIFSVGEKNMSSGQRTCVFRFNSRC